LRRASVLMEISNVMVRLYNEVDGLSMESFILHPEGYDGPSRAERTERAAP
jgi:hypothetical protein